MVTYYPGLLSKDGDGGGEQAAFGRVRPEKWGLPSESSSVFDAFMEVTPVHHAGIPKPVDGGWVELLWADPRPLVL